MSMHQNCDYKLLSSQNLKFRLGIIKSDIIFKGEVIQHDNININHF